MAWLGQVSTPATRRAVTGRNACPTEDKMECGRDARGTGVVAMYVAALPQSGRGGGIVSDADWLLITWGWGMAVIMGIYVAGGISGAHINPAVTIGLIASGNDLGGDTAVKAVVYIVAQLLGAWLGAVLCWAAYRNHYDEPDTPAADKLGTFSTAPGIRSYGWNVVTEIIATIALVLPILAFGLTKGLGESGTTVLVVSLLVVGIGLSLGGPTGYAINPTRDLGPRIVHNFLPIPNKGTSDWGYAWIPVVGPLIGGALAGLIYNAAF